MTPTKPSPLKWFNKTQLILGIITLLMGAVIYLTLRSPDTIYFTRFFGIHEALLEIQSPVIIRIGASMPAFLHVFAFSLITASFCSFSKKLYITICLGWFLVDCFFELGQKYKALVKGLGLDIFDKIPFLEATRNYFTRGTFDVFDLMAYGLGAITAYFVLLATATPSQSVGVSR